MIYFCDINNNVAEYVLTFFLKSAKIQTRINTSEGLAL